MAALLSGHVPARYPAQFLMDKRQQLVQGFLFPASPCQQQGGDIT